MKAKNLISILFLSLIVVNIQAQIRNIGDNQTAELILNSNKDYKLIYIFCNYCQASQARLPNVADFVKNRNDIEAFYICAQADFEVAEYMDTCKAKTTMYLINQQRKRKLIDFYNPIKATCKFIKKHFGVKTDKMGASDYFILDRNNQVIKQTNWKMGDEEYFHILNSI